MSKFMEPDFLLFNETARRLYHEVAEHLPIIDYHCHLSPKEIAEDKHFENLTEAWLGGDHYKWRLMRQAGIDETYITGQAEPKEKLRAYLSVMPQAIGNPLYNWSTAELRQYASCDLLLKPENTDAIWEQAQKVLPQRGAREFIKMSHVEAVITTDDPIDDLAYHKQIAADPSFDVVVRPGIRPDKAYGWDRDDYLDYLKKLAEAAGLNSISSLDDLKKALEIRVHYFDEHGCVSADHGLHHFPMPKPGAPVEEYFADILAGKKIGPVESDALLADLLIYLGRLYNRIGWFQQYHVNALRNINTRLFQQLGPDAGFDVMHDRPVAEALAALLDQQALTGELPRTILYSLNPNDNLPLAAIAGSYPGSAGHVRHGAAWWFNDTKPGMEAQIENFANVSLLANFAGMLTDSRSFLSYTRHDYFRRLFCNAIGAYVERGEYPDDWEALSEIVYRVCYGNSRELVLGSQRA